jgi:hypothetical protein
MYALQVMYSICRALQMRHNEVHVTSKRVGGGFGGKVRVQSSLQCSVLGGGGSYNAGGHPAPIHEQGGGLLPMPLQLPCLQSYPIL